MRTVADALRLDWARDLRWAVTSDPWSAGLGLRRRAPAPAGMPAALPGLEQARLLLQSDVGDLPPLGPLVLGVLDDAPLLGTLGNLHVAAGALALGQEMRAAVGAAVPVVLLLLGGPEARPKPLYALGRDGEVRRVAVARGSAGGDLARRTALALLGTMEAIAGRPWPEARRALDAAVADDRPRPEELWACWTRNLWRQTTAPFGATVLHWALPPLRAPLGRLTSGLLAARPAIGSAVHAAARQLRSLGLAPPEGPEAVFEAWRREAQGWHPVADTRNVDAHGAQDCGAEAGLFPGRAGALLLVHALLRPAAVVAGDEDVARLVLLSQAIRHLEGAPPAIRPRPRCTLVSPAEAAFARGHNAPLDQGPLTLRLARDHAFARASGGHLEPELTGLRGAMSDRLERLGREVAVRVPRASGLVRSRAERLLRGVDLLIAEVCARQRTEDRAQARAWRHLLSALYPFGADQDEWLSAYPWAAAGCRALLNRLCGEVPGPGRRWLRWPEPAARPTVTGPWPTAGAAEPEPAAASTRPSAPGWRLPKAPFAAHSTDP